MGINNDHSETISIFASSTISIHKIFFMMVVPLLKIIIILIMKINNIQIQLTAFEIEIREIQQNVPRIACRKDHEKEGTQRH